MSREKPDFFGKGYARTGRDDILCVGQAEDEPFALYVDKKGEKTVLASIPNEHAAEMLVDALDWIVLGKP